jgi:hypothetical protein
MVCMKTTRAGEIKAAVATAKTVERIGARTFQATFRTDDAAKAAAVALKKAGCTAMAAYSARFGQDAFVQFTAA